MDVQDATRSEGKIGFLDYWTERVERPVSTDFGQFCKFKQGRFQALCRHPSLSVGYFLFEGRFRASQLFFFAPAANHQPPIHSMCVTVANRKHQPLASRSRTAEESATRALVLDAANGR